MSRFLAVWARVVGRAAFARALPVWAGIAVIAGMLFGGNGIAAASLTGVARGSPGFGLGLAMTWLVLIVPAARAIVDPRATAWLRALPVARWQRGLVSGAIAVAVQGPWALLWGAGEGVLVGAAAAVGTAAVSVGIAVVAGRIAWPHRAPAWRGTFGAVLGAHRRLLLRGCGAAVVRALGIAWLGGAAGGLFARANVLDAGETVWWALAAAAFALPIALGALAQPVADGDRRLDWLLRASGCSWPERVAAAGVFLAAAGVVLGVVAAVGCAFVGDLDGGTFVDLVLWMAVLGAGLGGIALRAGAWAAARDDGTWVVGAMGVAAVGAFAAIGALGAVGTLAVAATGLATTSSLAAAR